MGFLDSPFFIVTHKTLLNQINHVRKARVSGRTEGKEQITLQYGVTWVQK